MMWSVSNWCRGLLLGGIYAIGVLGVLSSSSSSGSRSSGDFTCVLSVRGIAPLSDGSVWAGVFAKTSENTEDRVVLFNDDGSEQLGYVIGTGGSDNAIRAVALATDGSTDIYVGGDFSGGILRLNDDGTLDAAFDVGTGFNGRVTSIVPLANGQLYVGGYFTEFSNPNPISGLVRLNSDGSRDGLGFSAVGVTDVESVALSIDTFFGSVYSGSSGLNPVERWSSAGAQDLNFNPLFNPVFSVVPAADATGDIYFGGGFTNGIIRVFDNGNTNMGFDVDTGFDDDVVSIDRGAGGDIYVGGPFSTYQGASANGIVRLDSSGDRDFGFDVGSGFGDPNGIFPSSLVASVAEATDGSSDVLVGGGFTQYQGAAANGFLRLDDDGSIDNAFDVSITVDGETCDSQTIPDS